MNWFYWVSIILMWIATGLNVYSLVLGYRGRENLKQAMRCAEAMRVEYERARDAHLNRLNELSENENRKD